MPPVTVGVIVKTSTPGDPTSIELFVAVNAPFTPAALDRVIAALSVTPELSKVPKGAAVGEAPKVTFA